VDLRERPRDPRRPDLRYARRHAGPGATLKAYTFLGGVDIKVPPGTRVTSGGFSLFGGTDVRVRPGDGPEIAVRAFALFGGVNVSDESG
jgi:hypothetical protein